jgi:hypothetical protein
MNLEKTNAIYACYPSIVTIRGVEAFDANNNKINYDESVIQDYIDANAYKTARQYPSLGDQLDMLWHAIDSGTLNKTSDFYTTLKAVKDAYPKSGE